MIQKQKWYCESCNVRSEVEHDEHADVFSVVDKISRAHSKVSPDCTEDVTRVRVLNEPQMKQADWDRYNEAKFVLFL